MRRTIVAVAVGLLAVVAAPVDGVELPEVPKIELEPLAPGLPDPLDPPYIAALDTAVPPGAGAPHPRLLFSADDLPAIRARVADPATVPGRAFAALRARVDAYVPKPSTPDPQRTFGRDDIADAAFVWHVTQDPSYLDKARAIARSQVAAAPYYGAPAVFDATEYYNHRAHIVAGLALAHDLLHDALPPDELLGLQSALLVLGSEHFIHSLTSWWGTISTASNFTGNNGASVGLAGLSLYGDIADPVPGLWISRGRQLVLSYAKAGFDTTGAGYEGVLYGNYGLRIPSLFAAALTRAGGDNPLADPNVRRQQEWVAYEVLPGGGALNPLNDARYSELNETHLTWASSFGADPRLAAWIWDAWDDGRGEVGEPIATILWHRDPDQSFHPADVLPLAKAFPGRGLVHVRTGWGDDDLMLSFEARHNDWGEGVHQNQDVNSFTLYADGGRLVTDSGYANYLAQLLTGPADFAGMESSTTQAHNYIVADGRSQDFFGKGALRRFATTAVVGDPGAIDVMVGDARPAYLVLQPERADRYVLNVRGTEQFPDYVVVLDAFRQGGGDHTHHWFLHTDSANRTVVLPSGPTEARARTLTTDGDTLEISMLGGAPLRAFVDEFVADYAEIGRHPRLAVSTAGPAHESIATLVPTKGGTTAPELSRLDAGGGLAGVVPGTTGWRDVILLRTSGPTSASGAIQTDAEAALVRQHGGEVARTWTLIEGTRLTVAGTTLVEIGGGRATVVSSPQRVAAVGPVSTLRFLAPSGAAPEVRINNAVVGVARCGSYLVWPATC